MAAFARWTHLSETTYLLAPTDAAADYRVRIFTPGGELPFAGHPTLGSCHAWIAAGGVPHDSRVVVQQCEVGLVREVGEVSGFRFALLELSCRYDGAIAKSGIGRSVLPCDLPGQSPAGDIGEVGEVSGFRFALLELSCRSDGAIAESGIGLSVLPCDLPGQSPASDIARQSLEPLAYGSSLFGKLNSSSVALSTP